MNKLPWLVLALSLVASGCVEMEQEFTLNPDGSGKVAINGAHTPLEISLEPEKPKPADKALSMAKAEIEKAEGVDAWKDVSWSLRADGKFVFKGTAYFKDIQKLQLHNQGFSSPMLKIAVKREGANLVVESRTTSEPEGVPKEPVKLTEEEIKQRVEMERAKYRQMKPMIESALGGMSIRTKVNLPGKVGATAVFKKASETSAQLTLEGKTIVKGLDAIVADDKLMRQSVLSGSDLAKGGGPGDSDEAFVKIFGEKGPARAATTGPLAPLFPYAAEVAEAKKQQAELSKKLGATIVAAPAQGGAFKSLKVAGVKMVHFTDRERGITVMNSFEPGLSFSLVGEFPGAVLGVQEGRVEKAVSDTGEDLLPEGKWERRLHFPNLTQDKMAVVFDVSVKLPGAGAKGIREISGVLQYSSGGKTKDVDVGIKEFKAGAKGAEFGATVKKVEENSFQPGSQSIEVAFAVSRDTIKSVQFADEKGTLLPVTPAGYSYGGNSTTMSFSLKGRFPAAGRITATVYEDMKTFELPFSVKDVDLLGRPAK